MDVFQSVHQIRPLPGNKYADWTAPLFVSSFVRAIDLQSALEFAKKTIAEDGWEIVSLISANRAAMTTFSAKVAAEQGWQFVYDLGSIPSSFLEERGLQEDYEDV
jgi:hypothetical protein